MGLPVGLGEVSPNRPLSHLVVRAVTGRAPRRAVRRGPYAPPACPASSEPSADLHAPDVAALSEWLLRRLVAGAEPVAGLADEIAPDAVMWSPAAYASGADEVVALLEALDTSVGPLTEVSVDVGSVDVVTPRIYVEWRLEGRFTNPCFVEDDLLVKPTGRLVETAGVLVVTFDDDRVCAIHCYYDDFALLEQLLETA